MPARKRIPTNKSYWNILARQGVRQRKANCLPVKRKLKEKIQKKWLKIEKHTLNSRRILLILLNIPREPLYHFSIYFCSFDRVGQKASCIFFKKCVEWPALFMWKKIVLSLLILVLGSGIALFVFRSEPKLNKILPTQALFLRIILFV